ncbi:serine hydrolase [Nibricoccus aquaticus]|uniref:Serine hydrolase n=1 Tax=Nibricoccus aquaticus TaxID=2576891 RepID=A0A290Q8W1_9BACT|nr:serine hydrolase domain-containing protein [Nibricoccus aquaticus]ATC64954.1 serine hydrolase [Nibricoccus aquaticus]
MKLPRPARSLAPLAFALTLVVPALSLRAADPVNTTAPASATTDAALTAAGFSPARLQRLDTAIEDQIARHRLAGGIMYVARDGRPVVFKTYGLQDVENRQPMRADAIFRIASMSKAITTTAVMMLYEEGRFRLNDPVSKYLPAFKNSVVAIAPPAGSPADLKYVTEKAKRPITIRDLLTHTAGLTYGNGLAADAYKQAGLTDWYLLGKNETLEQIVNRLATLPLHGHPGEQFQYGYAADVLGRLVEVISGKPLDQFVEERITKPLAMRDTHFFLPPEKAPRLANVYGIENDQLVLKETAATSDFIHGPRKCFSGGAGLLSTTSDYTRFLQMLLNNGELDGVRLLAPKTVELMHANHTGDKFLGEGDGFGLGFWVSTDLGKTGEIGTVGSYGWGSAYFPEYIVDPKERLVIIFMTQLRPAGGSNFNHLIKRLTYQALIK